jgi:hypothetical protein
MTNELSRAGKILDELQCEARERVRMGGGRDMEVQSFAMALACDRIAAQDAELERLRGFVNWIRARQDAHLSCSQCHLSALMVLVVLEEIDRLDAKAKEGGT